MSSFALMFRVLFGFALAFIVLPWAILPRPKSAKNVLDHIVINFVRWTAVVFLLVHILAVVRLFETISLVLIFLVMFWYFKLRPRGWSPDRARGVVHGFGVRVAGAADGVERVGVRRARAERRAERAIHRREMQHQETAAPSVRPSLGQRLLSLAVPLLLAAPVIFVLAWSFWQRAELPAHNVTLSPPDAYVHMTWAKGLLVNKIYPDGIYPMGMASFIAFLAKFCFRADIADVTRFVGPLTGMLIVFGLFYTALRLTRNPGAAILAAGTFGLFGARAEWHEPWLRQIGPLPQEFALGLAILALSFAGLAVARRDRDHLITIGAATLAMGLTHPVPLAFFLGASSVMAFAVAPFVPGGLAEAVRVSIAGAVGAIAGLLFIPIAYLAGVKFYAGLDDFNPFVHKDVSTIAPTSLDAGTRGPLGHNLLSKIAAVSTIVGFVGGVVLVLDRSLRRLGAQIIGLSLACALILATYDVRWLGLDAFFAGRVANIVGPQLALCFAVGFGAVAAVFRRRFTLARAAVMIVLGLALIAAFGAKFPGGIKEQSPIEYNAEAVVTRDVKTQNERLTYTIVGTPEQRQLVLGDGFHVEAWVFARDVDLRGARDPGWELPIPTQSVYITAEKNPFPVRPLPARGATEEYYRNQVKRARIMTIIYQWAETYRRYHSDMTMYYDDANVRVYKITRQPDAKADDDSKLFKDGTYLPNQLFNSGPTVPTQAVIA